MTIIRTRTLSALAAAGALTLSLAGCGSSSSSAGSGSGATTTGATSASAAPMASAPMSAGKASAMTSAPMSSAAGSMMASGGTAMSAPFGPACSKVPTSGAGSFTGMATAPVATAASANPVLSTLVSAVKAAGLVDTLNSANNITVFAPDNAAFAKVPAAQLKALLANKAELTKVLTYHVVGSPITPAKLGSGGPFTSLEGGQVKATGSGTDFTVNGTAHVVCGGVHTANATVYIIDSVLMPPKA